MSDTPMAGERLSAQQVFDLAVAATAAGDTRRAEQLYLALLATGSPEVALNLGLLLEDQLRDAEAEAIYRQLLGKRDDRRVRFQLAALLLKTGRYPEGWPLFEARVSEGDPRRPRLSFPEWQGQAVRSLLVTPEQGLGDQIQYARFIPVLRRQGVEVTLICHPTLARLLGHLDAKVIPAEGKVDLARHDAWVLPASLPLRLGVTLETLPSAPYLPSQPSGGGGIGLMAKGNPHHVNDRRRSLSDEIADELLAMSGVRSLEPTATGARDFADTALVLDRLDLVVTVDTAVAHLAGAMGRPCWLLLPYNADWRWLRERSDSPWYPSIRIFRQPAPDDWRSVVEEVKAEVAAGAGAR